MALEFTFHFFFVSLHPQFNNMRKVIGIGETILDIIFRGNQPIQAVPGGSAYNALISLGRSGIPSMFIGETGDDRVGVTIREYLEQNGVDASALNVFPDTKSPVSLAFLNEVNDAEYIFYKDHPNDRLDFDYPDVQPDDIVLFSSFYAVNPVIRPKVKGFLSYAKSQGAILYYDVNFRASHQNDVLRITPNLLENLEMADIVRGSNEDFGVLFHKSDPELIYRSQISFYTRNFIYTQGSEPVVLKGVKFSKSYPVEKLETVSTIGAGDNFNAGFIYGLIRYDVTRDMLLGGLRPFEWDQVMACAQQFSANVCRSLNNSVDTAFGEEMKNNLK